MISLMWPGTSPLHRLAAGRKLLALIILISAISIFGSNPTVSLTALVAILGLFAIAFPTEGAKLFAVQLWKLKYLVLIIVVPQLLIGTAWTTIASNALRLTDAILLATLFTLTTKNSDLTEGIERACQPLKRIGIKPQTVSLTLAMAINAIPMLTKFAAQTREAQQARGVKPTPTLMAVPLLVASLKYADEFAEALTARGVEA
jgi:biotin transport system permease protein